MAKRRPGPSVKDDDQYEALRDQGASKEKAARIANASANSSRRHVGRRGGRAAPYDQWTKADLYQRARELSVAGRSSMSKHDLIDALRSR